MGSIIRLTSFGIAKKLYVSREDKFVTFLKKPST
jgi:hypothetical protein